MHVEKTIELQRNTVGYTLRLDKRSRGVRLSVASGGVFTVSAPPTLRQSRIEEFILQKAGWVLDKIAYFSKFPVRKPIRRAQGKKHFAEHKERARALVHERLEYFNQFYGVKWNRIAIRNQRSRWGSCSRKGNLNFSYKLALLPAHLSDYIIVHELCHLKELNHGQKFWDLVAKVVPNHRELRRELKKNSLS